MRKFGLGASMLQRHNSRGVRRDTFGGVHKMQLGVWGRCEPPSEVWGRAPEDFEIHAFQRL